METECALSRGSPGTLPASPRAMVRPLLLPWCSPWCLLRGRPENNSFVPPENLMHVKCRSPCLCGCSCVVCYVDLNARSLVVGEPVCRNLTRVHLDLCCLCEPFSDWTKEQRIGERPDASAGGHLSANLECGGALVFLPRPATVGFGQAAAAAGWCSHIQPRRSVGCSWCFAKGDGWPENHSFAFPGKLENLYSPAHVHSSPWCLPGGLSVCLGCLKCRSPCDHFRKPPS